MDFKETLKQATYALASRTSLTRIIQRLHMQRTLGILMYHGVVETPLPVPDWCFITAHEFRRQMEYLRRYVDVLPLTDAVRQLKAGSINRPTVAITFDDGYQNNCDVALPILCEFGIPATVFLVTNLVGTGDTMWFCRLNQAISETGLQTLSWQGRIFPLQSRGDRPNTSALLQSLLKRQPHEAMLANTEEILLHLGAEPQSPIDQTSPFRMLDLQSIRSMAESGLIEFGAHTSSHVILSRVQSPERRRLEIVDSIRDTERLTGNPCRSFAYPNGSPEDFDSQDIELLRGSGIDVAVTTISGPNDGETPPLALRRHGIGADCSMSQFQCLVHHFDPTQILRIGRREPQASGISPREPGQKEI